MAPGVKYCKNCKTAINEDWPGELVYIVYLMPVCTVCIVSTVIIVCVGLIPLLFPTDLRSLELLMSFSYLKCWRVVLVVPLWETRRECCQPSPSDGIYTPLLDIRATFEL